MSDTEENEAHEEHEEIDEGAEKTTGKGGKGKGGGGNANVLKRPELVAGVVEAVGLPRAVAVVDGFLEAIGKALAEGKEVRLPGFGAFVVSNRAAGKGRDPRTGEEIDVPASKSVRFRPAKALKESVNV